MKKGFMFGKLFAVLFLVLAALPIKAFAGNVVTYDTTYGYTVGQEDESTHVFVSAERLDTSNLIDTATSFDISGYTYDNFLFYANTAPTNACTTTVKLQASENNTTFYDMIFEAPFNSSLAYGATAAKQTYILKNTNPRMKYIRSLTTLTGVDSAYCTATIGIKVRR